MQETSLTKQLIAFLVVLPGPAAYATILGVLLACGLGVPIPEDITLVAAGMLASFQTISFTGAMLAGFFGVLAGDTILFFLGRRLGRRAFSLPLLRRIFTPERIVTAEEKIRRNSKMICFIARFLPGLRAPIFLTAGVMGVRPWVFLTLDGFAALISVPVWIYVGWFFGNNLDNALHMAKKIQIYLLIGIFALIAGWLFIKWRQKRATGPT